MSESTTSYARYAAIRDEQRLNDSQVARAIGISRQSMNYWKRGTFVLGYEKQALIAEYLGVPVESIYIHDEKKPRHSREFLERKGKSDYSIAMTRQISRYVDAMGINIKKMAGALNMPTSTLYIAIRKDTDCRYGLSEKNVLAVCRYLDRTPEYIEHYKEVKENC